MPRQWCIGIPTLKIMSGLEPWGENNPNMIIPPFSTFLSQRILELKQEYLTKIEGCAFCACLYWFILEYSWQQLEPCILGFPYYWCLWSVIVLYPKMLMSYPDGPEYPCNLGNSWFYFELLGIRFYGLLIILDSKVILRWLLSFHLSLLLTSWITVVGQKVLLMYWHAF